MAYTIFLPADAMSRMDMLERSATKAECSEGKARTAAARSEDDVKIGDKKYQQLTPGLIKPSAR